jgi:DNA-binding CsgD family transcriptional regulator
MTKLKVHRELTDHEIELVRMVAQGMSNAQIGQQFDLRPETVRSRLHTVYHLTGVSTTDSDPLVRVRLAIWAFDHGIVKPACAAKSQPKAAGLMPETIQLALDIMADRPRGDLRRWAAKVLDAAGVKPPWSQRRGRPVLVPADADEQAA